MNWEAFVNNVTSWAKVRGLLDNSSTHAQALKLVEEVGELAGGIARQDENLIKDALGDCAVVLVILHKMAGMPPKTHDKNHTARLSDLVTHSGGLLLYTEADSFDSLSVQYFTRQCLIDLWAYSATIGMNLIECCFISWDVIKDRKGYLSEDGVWIKESDNV